MHEPAETAGRRLHYGEFYGLLPIDPEAPIAVVVGNCQAESLRIMLDGPDLRTVRIPPVFELTSDDLPHLAGLLARTQVLVSQPVRDDYHDLPLGTAQLAALLPPGAHLVRIPVVRFAGLYPFQVIVRPPFDASLVPPLVEYHDLRTVVRALALREAGRVPDAGAVDAGVGSTGVVEQAPDAGSPGSGGPEAAARIHHIARQSLAELRRRESHHDTVIVSDLFVHPTFTLMRTINHPGNTVWSVVAARVRERLSLPAYPVDPGRELLNAVHAPREPDVIRAFGLDAEPRSHWLVGGIPVAAADVERAHLAWYAEHPTVVDAAIARHRGALDSLGLLPAGAHPPDVAAVVSGAAGSPRHPSSGPAASAASPDRSGTRCLPRQLVMGSLKHAVTAFSDALGGATDGLASADRSGADVRGTDPSKTRGDEGVRVRVVDLDALLTGVSGIRNVHLQFTDRLFGGTPEAAADLVVALAEGRRLTVTVHDLPQPSDGERNLPRRAAAYRRVVEAAFGVVCNSQHEALLLAQFTQPALRTEVAVIPLPVEPAEPTQPAATHAPPPTPTPAAAILGYFYPGKGHSEVIAAVAASGLSLAVTALGTAAPGHESELVEVAEAAAAAGVTFTATGYLDAADLLDRCRSAAVPVAAHQHLSASASINTWIAAGRRPLIPAGRCSREMEALRPGTVALYEPGELPAALEHAVAHPETTWIRPGVTTRPDLADTARRYLDWWGAL